MPASEALRRLGLASRLSATTAAAIAATEESRMQAVHVLERQAASLRDELLGRAAAGLDILSPHTAAPGLEKAMQAAMSSEVGDGSAISAGLQAAIAAQYVSWAAVGAVGVDTKTRGALIGLEALIKRVRALDTKEFRLARLEAMKSAGSAATDAAQSCQIDHERGKALRSEINAKTREARRAVNEFRAKRRGELVAEMDRRAKEIPEGDGDGLRRMVDEVRAGFDVAVAEFEASQNSAAGITTMAAELAEVNARNAERAGKLIEDLLSQSPVTEAEAKTWADAQVVTKAATARLKKGGYLMPDLRSDMARFYRLTGGRLSGITIQSDGSRRASADGIHGHSESVVNVDGNFDCRTLWHELAHHLEADPDILAAARGFLAKRGGTVKSMRALTGSTFYRPSEKAHEDGFFSPYVGKIYKDATEVISMGVESFCRPETLGARLAADPEHFELIAGILSSRQNPMFESAKLALKKAVDLEAGAKLAAESALEVAIKALAESCALDASGGMPDLGKEAWVMDYYLSDGAGEYLGSYRGSMVFSSKKVKDPKTGRKGAGFIVARQGESRVYEGSLVDAKATAAGWALLTGRVFGTPWGSIRSAPSAEVIRLAKELKKSMQEIA